MSVGSPGVRQGRPTRSSEAGEPAQNHPSAQVGTWRTSHQISTSRGRCSSVIRALIGSYYTGERPPRRRQPGVRQSRMKPCRLSREVSIASTVASALGALCGGLAVAVLLWRIERAKAPVTPPACPLAEAGDIGGFEQDVDLRHQSLVIFGGPQASEARKAVVAAQPAGLGEFGGGAFGLAGKRVSGSELGADVRMCPIGVARLFEPDDRLVRP